MSNRKTIPLKVQLAAALLQLVDDKGERLIPHADAKLMTADQVISLFNRDHYPIRFSDGGEDVHWNITWRLRAEHKRKTAKIDQPELGKQRRIRAREGTHRQRMKKKHNSLIDAGYTKIGGYNLYVAPDDPPKTVRKAKIPSRPFPTGRNR